MARPIIAAELSDAVLQKTAQLVQGWGLNSLNNVEAFQQALRDALKGFAALYFSQRKPARGDPNPFATVVIWTDPTNPVSVRRGARSSVRWSVLTWHQNPPDNQTVMQIAATALEVWNYYPTNPPTN